MVSLNQLRTRDGFGVTAGGSGSVGCDVCGRAAAGCSQQRREGSAGTLLLVCAAVCWLNHSLELAHQEARQELGRCRTVGSWLGEGHLPTCAEADTEAEPAAAAPGEPAACRGVVGRALP